MLNKIHIACLSAGLIGLMATPALAEDKSYPVRPIKLVVPFSAGGALDITARVLAERMSGRLGQPVVVDNKTGAAGVIGVDAVAKAPPDGYTISISQSSQLLVSQFLYKNLPYNPTRDLILVAKIADSPLVLLVNDKVPAKDGRELRDYLQSNRGKLSYGSWGVGTVAHLSGNRLNSATDAQMAHVAYRGEAPMVQDLAAGNLQLAFATGLSAGMFIQSGKLRAIGVTGATRLPTLPNVPTLAEQGFDDKLFRIVGWSGVAVPAGTPAHIVQRIAEEVQLAANTPEVRKRVTEVGFTPSVAGPTEFAAQYRRDLPVWQAVVRESGAQLD